MTREKPVDYTLTPTEDPKDDYNYVWCSEDYSDTDNDAFGVKFDFEGKSTNITFFPDRGGVKLTTSDSPGYDEGKDRALFGLVLIQLIRSGKMCIKEL